MRTPFTSLVALSTGAHAVALTVAPKVAPRVGLHSEYVVKGSDTRIQLYLPDYEDDIRTFEISGNFTPSVHFVRMDRALLERDICARITDCAGQAASSVAAWTSMTAQSTVTNCNGAAQAVNAYLTDNNYGAVRTLFAGTIIGIAINIVSTVPQYFMNAKLDATYGSSSSTNDACGERDPSTFAANAASAVYEFCLSIKGELESAATTDFDTLDMTSAVGSSTGGFQGRAKMFISEQAATWGPICSNDYGVNWRNKLRRDLKNVFGGWIDM